MALLALDEWISSLYERGFEPTLDDTAGPETNDGQEIVTRIVNRILERVPGGNLSVLQKSLLETFLSLFALDPEVQRTGFRDRLSRFLDVQGHCALIRRFLSLHLFNMVWLQTMDSFRGLARTQDLFMKDMQILETACCAAVEAGWKSSHMDHPLDTVVVGELLYEIERQFLGEDAPRLM